MCRDPSHSRAHRVRSHRADLPVETRSKKPCACRLRKSTNVRIASPIGDLVRSQPVHRDRPLGRGPLPRMCASYTPGRLSELLAFEASGPVRRFQTDRGEVSPAQDPVAQSASSTFTLYATRPATPDRPSASHLAAVTAERCHPDQGGSLPTGEGAELGQLGQQGPCAHGSDARHRAEQLHATLEVPAIQRQRPWR